MRQSRNKPRNKIPFFTPEISSSDKQKILKILDSKILTNGPAVEKFENSFKQFDTI